ncbi:heat shock protein DnaJ, partial [Cadophora sp. DSE1049]
MSSKKLPNYYQTLGLSRDSAGTEIRSKYRKLALLNHPDKKPNDPTATAKFQLIVAAAEILTDPIACCMYDRNQFGKE